MEEIGNEVVDHSKNEDATVWSQKDEEVFINLMEEEVIKGNRSTTTFSKSAWQRILVSLCAKTKKSYTEGQIKNKFNQLRQKQKDFKRLLQETSIGYNAVTGQVTASDDVWDKLIRVKINNLYFLLVELSSFVFYTNLIDCRSTSLLKNLRRKTAPFLINYAQFLEIPQPLVPMFTL